MDNLRELEELEVSDEVALELNSIRLPPVGGSVKQ